MAVQEDQLSALLYQGNYLTAEAWANTAEIQPPLVPTWSQLQRQFFVIAEDFHFHSSSKSPAANKIDTYSLLFYLIFEMMDETGKVGTVKTEQF